MIWISAAYRIFKSGVKPEARKMRLWGNKKGKSIGSDSPFWVVIKIEYHRFFGVSKVPIRWRYQRFLKKYSSVVSWDLLSGAKFQKFSTLSVPIQEKLQKTWRE